MKCDFIIICKAPPLHHHYLALSRSSLLLFFFFFFNFFLTGRSLLYNVLLVSAIQRHELALSIHISPHS